MPSPQTLKKIMANISVRPGVNKAILEALRIKTANMQPQDKIVSIVFDEMSIREGLAHDKGRDIIEGFADGVSRSEQIANHALVFMVR